MNKHWDPEQGREAAEGQKANPHFVGSSLKPFPITHNTNQALKQLLWQQPADWLLNRETDRAPVLYKEEFY